MRRCGKLDPSGQAEIVINLQGDFPTIRPDNIRDVLGPLDDPAVDIATLAAEIHTDEESSNPNVVKVIGSPLSERRLRALYFTRATAPWGDGPRYHHVGLYAYRRAALQRFVALPPSAAGAARKSSNSSARSRPACGSTWPSSTRCRAASIPRRSRNRPPDTSQNLSGC